MSQHKLPHPSGTGVSFGRTQLVLGILGLLLLGGYFVYTKFGFFGIPGLFYINRIVTYNEATYTLDSYRQPHIEELQFSLLKASMEPKMSPFRDDYCTVITDRASYEKYASAYKGQLCEGCAATNFNEFSILGQIAEDVEYDTPGLAGFNKYVFKDTQKKVITYIVASRDVYNPKTSLINVAQAAYLEPDFEWLIKIPRIPDGYSVECLAWTSS